MTQVPQVTPEIPPAKWRVMLTVLRRLPQGGLSRSFGRVADVPIPRPLRTKVLGAFATALGIDIKEAALPLEEYRTINEFFVRQLKPGLRSWPTQQHLAASPVDGIVGQFGKIGAGDLIQAKGRRYSAAGILDDEVQAQRYQNGCFITIYLSPRHYHRIHTPTPGEIVLARHVPGYLLPVNEAAVMHVENLFCKNERLITYVDGPLGRIAVVAIGAYNVGRISAAFDPQWSGEDGTGWVTNRKGVEAETRRYVPPKLLKAGAEIMAFHLGSTVVLLFEGSGISIYSSLEPGGEVKVGEPIARIPDM
jgi:phosphatidylserine decarboxylase